MANQTTVVAAIAITIGSLYIFFTPSSLGSWMSQHSPATEGVPGLEFKLSQISKNPPSLLVTLKNSSPSSTFTILKWGTPLDPQATNLGVFKLVDAETGKEVSTDIIKISRKMPPSRVDLQEIESGTEHAIEVVLNKPWVPTKKPAKYKVRVEGVFHGVWEKRAGEIKENELESYTDSAFDNAPFASEAVVLLVE